MKKNNPNNNERRLILINNLLFVFTAVFPVFIIYYFINDEKSPFILYAFVIPGFIYIGLLILWNIFKLIKKKK